MNNYESVRFHYLLLAIFKHSQSKYLLKYFIHEVSKDTDFI